MKHKRLNKAIRNFYSGNIDLPRKQKLALLGRRINKSKLQRRIQNVTIIHFPYPSAIGLSDEFCPKCGCTATRSTGNMVGYPERWDQIFCARCNEKLWESDNSPYYHCFFDDPDFVQAHKIKSIVVSEEELQKNSFYYFFDDNN